MNMMKDPHGVHPDYDLPQRAEDAPPLPEPPSGWAGLVLLLLCAVMGTCAYCRS